MIALFGYSDDYETSMEQGNMSLSKTDSDRCAFTLLLLITCVRIIYCCVMLSQTTQNTLIYNEGGLQNKGTK